MKQTKGAGAVAEQGGRFGEGASEALSKAGSWPKRTRAFLEDVRAEMRRVTWPTFKQVRATTIVVLITVAFFGAYLGLLDVIFTRAIAWVLRLGQ
jgi:preprotein translocase subunit SecE